MSIQQISEKFEILYIDGWIFCFDFTVEEASLRNNGFLKPNPYVELLIDNKSKRKTDLVKNSYLPKWNEEFTVLVSNAQVMVCTQTN